MTPNPPDFGPSMELYNVTIGPFCGLQKAGSAQDLRTVAHETGSENFAEQRHYSNASGTALQGLFVLFIFFFEEEEEEEKTESYRSVLRPASKT